MADPRSVWQREGVNRFFAPAVVLLVTSSISMSAAGTEAYRAAAVTTLSLEAGELVQRYTVSCEATDAAAGAHLATASRDIRFFLAPDQAAAASVDEAVFAVDDVITDGWTVAALPGARLFARLVARCGTADVFDEITVDSAPLIVAPQLTLPSALQRTDDLRVVGLETIPVAVEVEIVGLSLLASPRGDEVVTIEAVGAGVDTRFDVTAADIVDGRAAVAPSFTATELGDVVVTARFFDVISAPVTLLVVDDDGGKGGVGLTGGSDTAASCASSSSPLMTASLLSLLLLLRRRRRR